MNDFKGSPEASIVSTAAAVHTQCPHCQNPIEIIGDAPEEIQCTACGNTFQLEQARTRAFATEHKRLGKFELLKQVGAGSFGAVWKALDTELGRRVAVKIPHAGRLPSAEEAQRFLREGRSSAQLRHPGIVSVHEVGCYAGLPYLVSDFIEGETLSDFQKKRRLTFKESAELLAEISEALHYAHSKGVIHRDIKSSNIMVERLQDTSVVTIGADKGKDPLPLGKPLILDFGVALRDDAEITMTLDGQVIGTPAYMSPEQAAGLSHKVDGRTDIYSLGVVLYQLLTGEMPFHGNSRMVIDQVLREEPRNPRKLNDRIPRDLETICLKSMAKEASRRYGDAHELAEDLRRYLNKEPIHARPFGRPERLWRWCQRKPAVAGLTTALIFVFVGGFAGVTFQWIRAEAERQIADKARNQALINLEEADRQRALAGANFEEANRQRVIAEKNMMRAEKNFRQAREAVDDFFLRVSEGKLRLLPGAQPLRKELLESALKYYRSFREQKNDDPAVQADMAASYSRIGDITNEIGAKSDALISYIQALGVWSAVSRANPTNSIYKNRIATTYSKIAIIQQQTGQLEDSIRSFRRAISMLEKLVQENPEATWFTEDLSLNYRLLSPVQQAAGQKAESIRSLEKSLELNQQLAANNSEVYAQRQLAEGYSSLGQTQNEIGQIAESLRSNEQGKKILESLLADNPELIEVQVDLARNYLGTGAIQRQQGKLGEALRSVQTAIEIQRKILLSNPTSTDLQNALATGYVALATTQRMMGLKAEGIRSLQKEIAIRENVAHDNPAVSTYKSNLANSYKNLGLRFTGEGQAADALALHEKALVIQEKLVKEDPLNESFQQLLVVILEAIADVRMRIASPEAIPYYQRATEIKEKLFDANPANPSTGSWVAAGFFELAKAFGSLNRQQEGLDAMKQVVKYQQFAVAKAAGDNSYHKKLSDYYVKMAQVQRQLNKADDAVSTAISRKALWPKDGDQLYSVAADLALSIPLATDATLRAKYSTLAVETLQAAVDAGWKGAAILKKNEAFASLRDFPAYKELLAKLK